MDRRTYLSAVAVIATGSIAGCLGDGSGSADETVEVGPGGNFTFEPGTDEPLRISPKTTVEFVWRSDTHNIVVEEQPEAASWAGHEQIKDAGFSLTYTFEVPGAYHYVCEPHVGMGMVGDVIVEEEA